MFRKLIRESLDQSDELFPASYQEFTESITDSLGIELKAIKAGLKNMTIEGKKFQDAVPNFRVAAACISFLSEGRGHR